jgi:hypothetical protein
MLCTLYQILLRPSSKMGMNCAGRGIDQHCVQNFRRKTVGKWQLYRRRRRWLYNIKVDFNPLKTEAQSASFKDPVRTAL